MGRNRRVCATWPGLFDHGRFWPWRKAGTARNADSQNKARTSSSGNYSLGWASGGSSVGRVMLGLTRGRVPLTGQHIQENGSLRSGSPASSHVPDPNSRNSRLQTHEEPEPGQAMHVARDTLDSGHGLPDRGQASQVRRRLGLSLDSNFESRRTYGTKKVRRFAVDALFEHSQEISKTEQIRHGFWEEEEEEYQNARNTLSRSFR